MAALSLLAAGCSSDGPGEGDGSGKGSPTGSNEPTEAKPTDTTGPIKDAALAAGSVVVTRTTTPAGAAADPDDTTHEDIEVEFTEPLSGRVLHVGEAIWTLDVVDGVGYLKDQSEKKSTNRWTKLTAAGTQERLEGATLDGLLGVLDSATKISTTEKATVRGIEATCHAITLGPPKAAKPGPVPQSARICVDADRRPVELVVTADTAVSTSVFTDWGVAIEAMPPPANLVD